MVSERILGRGESEIGDENARSGSDGVWGRLLDCVSVWLYS